MEISEIFSELSAHMVKGIMVHSQMADYYRFLGLTSYADCHEKRFKKESQEWRKLCKYYIKHYDRLIEETRIDNPNIIPSEWYKVKRWDVDINTMRKAVEKGLDMWVLWETGAKKLYSDTYRRLMDMGEVATASFIDKILCETDDELAMAKSYVQKKRMVNYDAGHIVEENNVKEINV